MGIGLLGQAAWAMAGAGSAAAAATAPRRNTWRRPGRMIMASSVGALRCLRRSRPSWSRLASAWRRFSPWQSALRDSRATVARYSGVLDRSGAGDEGLAELS